MVPARLAEKMSVMSVGTSPFSAHRTIAAERVHIAWRIWSTNRSSRPSRSRPRAAEWFLLGEHLLLHAAPLMWFTGRTIVILQATSPRARCQDLTRREEPAERRRDRLLEAVGWATPRSSKAATASAVGEFEVPAAPGAVVGCNGPRIGRHLSY